MPKIELFHVVERQKLVYSVIEVPPFRPSLLFNQNKVKGERVIKLVLTDFIVKLYTLYILSGRTAITTPFELQFEVLKDQYLFYY